MKKKGLALVYLLYIFLVLVAIGLVVYVLLRSKYQVVGG